MSDHPCITKVLAISTGHLTEWQRDRMTAVADTIEYGWLMYAFEDRPGEDDMGDELWALCEFARKLDCTYIKFDCDAAALPEFPTFEW